MDSLANYASDGENSNNSEDQKTQYPASGDAGRRASDANYDPVQMDMSEESNNNNSSRESSNERTNSPLTASSTFNLRTETSRTLSSSSDQRRSDHENHRANSSEEHKRAEANTKQQAMAKIREKLNLYHRTRGDCSNRESRDLRRSREDDNKSRDEEKRKEKLASSKDERRREFDRGRNYRQRRSELSGSRDRRRSRDVRSKDRHREDRSNHHKDRVRARSRSRSRSRSRTRTRSRDRAPPPFRTMSYREEKGRNKLAQLEKLGIELKPPEGDTSTPGLQTEQNYYNPLATSTQGKYAEQIQKRKLLWANKSKQEEGKSASTGASTANTWVGTTFTHDVDGKLSAKFKRLMGIKDGLAAAAAQASGTAKPDILKKQEEMFNNMEQQYEVARATTHTQRGVGLGYATGGYQFPR